MKNLKIIFIIFLFITQKVFALENKIIFKIDNEPLTTIDLLYEIKRLKFFEKNISNLKNEEIYKIASQTLINHIIKKIEVSKRFTEIRINDEEYLNSIINSQIKKLGFQNIDDFRINLIKYDLEFENYKNRLIVDILWNEIIYNLYSQKVNIDIEALKSQITNRGDKENMYLLKEIIFSTNEKSSVSKIYETIKKDIDTIGFEASALKYSISSTSEKGGEIGWLNENLFNDVILEEIKKLKKFDHTGPIRTQGGFAILQLIDKKKINREENLDDELKKLINIEKNNQLKNYSNLYFNKLKKNIQINVQ
ncbi:peptidylprolyl isomerase [Candidatus Pelagibacter sp.]|jgi:peptidyl-prolyl cis-trans isomerase SurA|nr:peptidylprolyl isomerase [Candidatus Pelagibacter sp.]